MPHGVEVLGGVREKVWAGVRAGVHLREAAESAGVSYDAARLWLRDCGGVIPPSSRAGRAGCAYRRLTVTDRETIGLMLAAGHTQCQVAEAIGVHKSTISREVRRHASRKGSYRPLTAQARAEATARTAHARPRKLSRPGRLRRYVVAGLEAKWSPQEISYRLRRDHPDDPVMRVSAETIYQSLFVQARGSLKRELTAYLRTQRTRRHSQTRRVEAAACGRGRLAGTISIRERPAEAEDRAVPGHWEGDLIIGANNASAIGTLVERSTRFVMLIHLPRRRTAEEFYQALTPTIAALPDQLRRSLTWDNGKEMGMHHRISMEADMPIYFADPHSPWQRGSNENTNGLLRQYFPKGTSLRRHTPDDLAAVARELNGRPRKTLDWRTPAEALNDILGQPYETTVLR
ncbi:MAG TPA: IS30 family transposase [Nocardioidaceae bacterium]|nr:IS30 family transposase [Nocardioidaceae bacterium]